MRASNPVAQSILSRNPRLLAAVEALPCVTTDPTQPRPTAPAGAALLPPFEMLLHGSHNLSHDHVTARSALDLIAPGDLIQGVVTAVSLPYATVHIQGAFRSEKEAGTVRIIHHAHNTILPSLGILGSVKVPLIDANRSNHQTPMRRHDALQCVVIAKATPWGGTLEEPNDNDNTVPLRLSLQEQHLEDPDSNALFPLGNLRPFYRDVSANDATLIPCTWFNGVPNPTGKHTGPLESPFYDRFGLAVKGRTSYGYLERIESKGAVCHDAAYTESLAVGMGVSLEMDTSGKHSTYPSKKGVSDSTDYVALREEQHRKHAVQVVHQGASYARKRDNDKATALFHKALSYDRNCADAYVGLGAVSANQGAYTAALAAFEKALLIAPEHANAKKYLLTIEQKVAKEGGGKRLREESDNPKGPKRMRTEQGAD